MKRLFYSIFFTIILFFIPIEVSASAIAVDVHDTIYKPGKIFIFEAKVDSVSKHIHHSKSGLCFQAHTPFLLYCHACFGQGNVSSRGDHV